MSRKRIIEITTKKGPMTVKQIALDLHRSESTIRTSIRRMRAHGTELLRIAGWAQDVPMYGPGPGEDVDGGGASYRLLDLLENGERATVTQIAQRLGITKPAAESAIRRLREKPGQLRIAGWSRSRGKGGRESPIWTRGPGEDEPRPDFTDAAKDYYRRYNEKRRVKKGRTTRQKNRGQTATMRPMAGFFDGLMR